MEQVFLLRIANPQDIPAIRSLIREAGINPLGLNWERFIVAVDRCDHVIGCGQIKSHRDGSHELASITVQRVWRQRGVASEIIERLLVEDPGILYLTCREHLEGFYARFGFQVIQVHEMPAYFRQVFKFFSLLHRLKIVNVRLLVMSRQGKRPLQGG